MRKVFAFPALRAIRAHDISAFIVPNQFSFHQFRVGKGGALAVMVSAAMGFA